MNSNNQVQNPQYGHYQNCPEEVAQCSKIHPQHAPPTQHAPTTQLFASHHKGMKVCLKRPDGSMVEQTHLKVSHTKDGKFVINTNGQPNQWLAGGGTTIRAILIDNKQGGGQQLGTTSVQLPPGTRLVSPHTATRHVSPTHVTPLQSGARHAPAVSGHMAHASHASHAAAARVAVKSQQGNSMQPHHDNGRAQVRQSTPQNVKVKPARHPAAPHPPARHPAAPQYATQHVRQHQQQVPSVRPTFTNSPVNHNGLSRQDSGEMYMKQQQQRPAAAAVCTQHQRPAPVHYRAPQAPSTPVTHNPPQWNNNSVLNGICSIGSGTRKRDPSRYPQDASVLLDMKPTPSADRKRPRRSSERGGKGLRHFSSKVCEKVKSKGVTTYLEVSEELVQEFSQNILVNTPSCNSFDVKNIRRRVYDALNVLCAMNIISKDKKEIRWIGLPTNSLQECRALEIQKQEMQQRIKEKKARAQEFMLQLIAYRTLIQRNRDIEERTGPLPENAAIQVPFIILSTGPNTQIGLEVADDKTEYEFTFNEIFEIHDEIAILKKMGFCYGIDTGDFTAQGLAKAESLLPKSAKPFLKELFPRRQDVDTEEQKPLEIVEHPQQISIKHEPVKLEPQELSEVQKEALKTYSFDAPTYSSAYPTYSRAEGAGWEQHNKAGTAGWEQHNKAGTAGWEQHNKAGTAGWEQPNKTGPADGGSKARDTAAANALLSLTSANQGG